MTLEEFRNRRYIPIWLLTFGQRDSLVECQRWSDSAKIWTTVNNDMSRRSARKAAHCAMTAFPELREGE